MLVMTRTRRQQQQQQQTKSPPLPTPYSPRPTQATPTKEKWHSQTTSEVGGGQLCKSLSASSVPTEDTAYAPLMLMTKDATAKTSFSEHRVVKEVLDEQEKYLEAAIRRLSNQVPTIFQSSTERSQPSLSTVSEVPERVYGAPT